MLLISYNTFPTQTCFSILDTFSVLKAKPRHVNVHESLSVVVSASKYHHWLTLVLLPGCFFPVAVTFRIHPWIHTSIASILFIIFITRSTIHDNRTFVIIFNPRWWLEFAVKIHLIPHCLSDCNRFILCISITKHIEFHTFIHVQVRGTNWNPFRSALRGVTRVFLCINNDIKPSSSRSWHLSPVTRHRGGLCGYKQTLLVRYRHSLLREQRLRPAWSAHVNRTCVNVKYKHQSHVCRIQSLMFRLTFLQLLKTFYILLHRGDFMLVLCLFPIMFPLNAIWTFNFYFELSICWVWVFFAVAVMFHMCAGVTWGRVMVLFSCSFPETLRKF